MYIQKTTVTLLFVLLAAGHGFAQKMSRPRAHRPAADFTLKTPTGEDIRLSTLHGQYVLIDFWASWCMPCREEIPHLKTLYERYHAAGLEIISISVDAHPENWKRAMQQERMPWKQVLDSYSGTGDGSDVAAGYGVQAIPFTVLLDKEGVVVAVNPDPEGLDKELKKIFGGR